MRPIIRTKLRRFFRFWLMITIGGITAPLRDRLAFIQLLAIPIFLKLVFWDYGAIEAIEEARKSITAAQAILYTIPIYILWCVVSSLFLVKKADAKLGQ